MQPPVSDNNEPVSMRNSRANLHRLLDEMIEAPERRTEITAGIDAIFGQDKAVMVLDMSGFSRTTQRHGIVSFLLMIHQMKRLALPCIDTHRGLLLKDEADNLFCLFDAVAHAVDASRDIGSRLSAANLMLPEDRRLYASIGIGFGRILNIADEDLFGDEVNLASKLGEDIAAGGEVLLTPAAYAQVEDGAARFQEDAVSISGLSLPYYRLRTG
jgi:adenylate cyclase